MAAVFKEFEYRPRRLQTIVLFLLCCGGLALFGYFSMYAEGGVIHGVRLTKMQQRAFFFTFFVLSSPSLLLFGALVLAAFFRPRRIAFTLESIMLPKKAGYGLSTAEIEIPFTDIRNVVVRPISGQSKVLRIEHSGGVILVPSDYLRNKQTFQEVADFVQAGFMEYRGK